LQKNLPKKIADWNHKDSRRRLGDCIYDYSANPPTQRKGVHNERNVEKDLSGKYALLSKHFYYFGENAIEIPSYLQPIIHQTQGHKSNSNDPYKDKFVEWIEGLTNYQVNKLYGKPQLNIFNDPSSQAKCVEYRATEKDKHNAPC